MKKKSVSKKAVKSKSPHRSKKSSDEFDAMENDFIIIAGGGLVVLFLTVVLFFLS